jgi:hypothetical protein
MREMIYNRLRRPLNIVVGFLVIVGVCASVAHYFLPLSNQGFRIFPLIVALHVILGGVYLALAPLQFVKWIRSRWLNYHRWAGRLLVAIGLVAGATALFMAWVIPFAGWPERMILGFFGVLFLVELGKGFLHIRARQTKQHREWMIRAFALALAIATMRLIFFPAMILVGARTHEQLATLTIIADAVAFPLHAVVAEVWIRSSRRKQVPAAGAVKARARGQVDVVS